MEDSNHGTEEHLLTGKEGHLFLLLSGSWLIIRMGRHIFPPLLPAITDELSITPAQAGVALTAMWVVYAFSQYPGGKLSDQLSRATVIVPGLGITICGFLLLSVTSNIHVLIAGIMLLGLGTGLYVVPMRALLSDIFAQRRAQAFGINQAAGMAGSALSGGLAVVMLAFATWQAAFLPLALVLAFVTFLLHRWRRSPYTFTIVDLGGRGGLGRIFQVREIRWLLLAFALHLFVQQGVIGFLPVFLQTTKGYSPVVASSAFTLVYIVGMVAMPISGRLSDSIRRIVVAAGSLLIGVAGLLGMLMTSSWNALLLSIILFSIGVMAFLPAIEAYLMDCFPDTSQGGDFGAFRTISIAIGSLGPSYVGIVASRLTYTVAFAGMAVLLVVNAIIVLTLMYVGE